MSRELVRQEKLSLPAAKQAKQLIVIKQHVEQFKSVRRLKQCCFLYTIKSILIQGVLQYLQYYVHILYSDF